MIDEKLIKTETKMNFKTKVTLLTLRHTVGFDM